MRNFLPTAYGIKIIINYKMIDNYSNGMNSERRGASQGMHEPHQTPFRAHNVKHQNAEGLSLINTNCIKRTAAASIYTLNAMASSTHNPFPLWFLIVRLHQHAVLCAHVALEKGCCWCAWCQISFMKLKNEPAETRSPIIEFIIYNQTWFYCGTALNISS